ncbi:MAG: DUF3828 domain-containing protein [Anaerolineae bacterium]|nr:DUF3828 domain-containing protein [Anaerolineae bacterium]
MKRSVTAILIIVLALAACHTADTIPVPTAPPTPPPDLTPEQTLEEFYDFYLNFPGNLMVDNRYRDHPFMQQHLTPEFVTAVDDLIASFEFGGYDPFICAQALPNTIDVGPADTAGDRAMLPVETDFEGHRFTVEMIHSDGLWRIDAIICQAPEGSDQPPQASPPTPDSDSSALGGWQPYRNEEYRFSLSIPTGWQTQFIPVEDHADIDPVEGYVIFNDEASIPTPLALVIVSGTLDDYHRVFPAPDDAVEERKFGTRTIPVEEPFPGETYYLLDRGDGLLVALRVIARDEPVDSETQAIVDAMLASFTFLS